MIKRSKIFEVYEDSLKNKRRLFTINSTPGLRFFSENIIRQQNLEFREWDPYKSKLAALILNGCTNIGVRKGNIVLYLGCSHGYTASFVSDIVGKEGLIFAVDISARVMRDFMFLSEKRKNLVPILADANKTKELEQRICLADILYQDLAQKNQVQIFLKSAKNFLKDNGYAILCVKARSINVVAKPDIIYNSVRKEIGKELTIIDFRKLEPYQKDHCVIICIKKPVKII